MLLCSRSCVKLSLVVRDCVRLSNKGYAARCCRRLDLVLDVAVPSLWWKG